MLSGNKLIFLPESLSKCFNLELLRIAANNLTSFPTVLLSLPKLSWLAYSGNPFCKKHPDSKMELQTVKWNELIIKELLGEGASGNIYKAIYNEEKVAIKIFKGEMTSDGLPQEEIDINISMGVHENLIDFKLSTQGSLKILKGIANAAVHMHERGIMHGDFYAHNIMIDKNYNSILGDFGGASYYESEEPKICNILEKLEVRAFGCLIEELLSLCSYDNQDKNIKESLLQLQVLCLNKISIERPLFKQILKLINEIV